MNSVDSGDGGTPGYFSDGEDLSGAENIRCPGCGTTLMDLYKDGLLGCSECYVTFKSTVHRALIVLHGDHIHVGKSIHPDNNY